LPGWKGGYSRKKKGAAYGSMADGGFRREKRGMRTKNRCYHKGGERGGGPQEPCQEKKVGSLIECKKVGSAKDRRRKEDARRL